MEKKRIDMSWRNKELSMTIPTRSFPIDEERFSDIRQVVGVVEKRKGLSVTIRIDGSEDYQEILVTHTGQNYYMEIVYPMDIYGWTHPLHLANDSLTVEEAEEVLRSVLVDEDDQNPMIVNQFRDISSSLYPEAL